jgi:hypothetical protein
MTLEQQRLENTSLYYFIKNLFSSYPMITVIDSFPDEELTLPTLAVDGGEIDTSPSELGNRIRLKYRTWYIDVFALTKTQRDDLGFKILNALEETIPVYNYNEGFPPDTSPNLLGGIVPDEIRLEPIKILPELTEKMYYRMQVTFVGHYNKL